MTERTNNRRVASRFFLSAFAAGGITFGLFAGMQTLVKVDVVELNDPKIRGLSNVVLKEPPTTIPIDNNQREFEKIKVEQPPPPRKLEKAKAGDIQIDYTPISGAVPEVPILVTDLPPVSGPIEHRPADPVIRPVPDYPERALRKNLEGDCNVKFSVDAAGRPFNVEAQCSDNVFTASSEKAVRKALFAAKVENGIAKGQDNLVFPIVYSLSGD